MRSGAARLLCTVLLWAAACPCEAKPPDPAASYVSPRVVVCPAGDSLVVVVARDFGGAPWSDGPIQVDFCDCPGFRVSRAVSPCTTLDTCRVGMSPDPTGTVEIPVSGGGLCPGGSVLVLADGFLLRTLSPPACFDQDGDLMVDGTDEAIVRAKLGTGGPEADFDGDGTVTETDVTVLLRHLGHASPDHSAPASRAPKPGR